MRSGLSIATKIIDIIPTSDPEYSHIQTTNGNFLVHSYMFNTVTDELKNRKVKIITDAARGIYAIFSLDADGFKRKLYSHSPQAAANRDAECINFLADVQFYASDAYAKQEGEWIQDQYGDHDRYFTMESEINHHRKKEFGIRAKSFDYTELMPPSYNFEEMEAVTRGHTIMEAAKYFTGEPEDIYDDKLINNFYMDYASIGKYLPLKQQVEKRRDFDTFVAWVIEVLGEKID